MQRIILVMKNKQVLDELRRCLEATGELEVASAGGTMKHMLPVLGKERPHALITDVHLEEPTSGIDLSRAARSLHQALPVIMLAECRHPSCCEEFIRFSPLTHFAFVNKADFILPALLLTIIKDVINGRGYICPCMAEQIRACRERDQSAPAGMLGEMEAKVARLLGLGLDNEQIARSVGVSDSRCVSRINGQIYSSWKLDGSSRDIKVARTRAALIWNSGHLIRWENGEPEMMLDNNWTAWDGDNRKCTR